MKQNRASVSAPHMFLHRSSANLNGVSRVVVNSHFLVSGPDKRKKEGRQGFTVISLTDSRHSFANSIRT